MILGDTTKVRPGDSRPIGPAGHCTYCREPIGSDHKPDCVIRQRTVVLRMTIEYVASVPADWTPEQIEFHRNDSSWCCGNAVKDIVALHDGGDCMCDRTSFEYVREATGEDHAGTPETVREKWGDQ